jgi:hypothetical protein
MDKSKPYSLDNLDLGVAAARPGTDQRPVAAYLPDGTLHKGYVSLRDAAVAVNGKMWGITSVGDGLQVKDAIGRITVPKSYRAYKWRWLEGVAAIAARWCVRDHQGRRRCGISILNRCRSIDSDF